MAAAGWPRRSGGESAGGIDVGSSANVGSWHTLPEGRQDFGRAKRQHAGVPERLAEVRRPVHDIRSDSGRDVGAILAVRRQCCWGWPVWFVDPAALVVVDALVECNDRPSLAHDAFSDRQRKLFFPAPRPRRDWTLRLHPLPACLVAGTSAAFWPSAVNLMLAGRRAGRWRAGPRCFQDLGVPAPSSSVQATSTDVAQRHSGRGEPPGDWAYALAGLALQLHPNERSDSYRGRASPDADRDGGSRTASLDAAFGGWSWGRHVRWGSRCGRPPGEAQPCILLRLAGETSRAAESRQE